jgi:hypothetical protein
MRVWSLLIGILAAALLISGPVAAECSVLHRGETWLMVQEEDGVFEYIAESRRPDGTSEVRGRTRELFARIAASFALRVPQKEIRSSLCLGSRPYGVFGRFVGPAFAPSTGRIRWNWARSKVRRSASAKHPQPESALILLSWKPVMGASTSPFSCRTRYPSIHRPSAQSRRSRRRPFSSVSHAAPSRASISDASASNRRC